METQVLSVFLLCRSPGAGFVLRQLRSCGIGAVVSGETSKLNIPSREGQRHLAEVTADQSHPTQESHVTLHSWLEAALGSVASGAQRLSQLRSLQLES